MSEFDDWKKEYIRKGDLEQYAWIEYDPSLDTDIEVVSLETIKALPADKVIPVELHNDRMKAQNRNRRIAELQYAGVVNGLYSMLNYFEEAIEQLEKQSDKTAYDNGLIAGMRDTIRFFNELARGCEPPDGFQSRARLDDRYGISVQGTVEVPGTVTHDEFWDKFISFIEENGWYFAGSMEESRFEE